MPKTSKGLISHCRKAQAEKWKYVYGAKGKKLTKAEIQSLQNIYGKKMVWDSDLNKAGSVCCDCSGLPSSYTGIIRNSSGYRSSAVEEIQLTAVNWGKITANWSKYVGYGIWRNGHIGIISDKEGYYMAMDGSSANFAERKIFYKEWTSILKLKDIDYADNAVSKKKTEYYPVPKLQTGTLIATLDSIGIDSSKENRTKIATKNGISDYKFTYEQNVQLLNLLRKGKLKK